MIKTRRVGQYRLFFYCILKVGEVAVNEQNLTPFTSDQSHEEAVKNGRKGGIASGQARRKNKAIIELAKMVGDNPADAKQRKKLAALGIEDEDATNNARIVGSLFNKALSGDVNAIDKWQKLVETTGGDSALYELPAVALGKAYVDINREIIPNKKYVFEGGRGSLKSSYVSLKVVELLKNNPGIHACVVRKVANTMKDSVYAQIKWAINILGLSDEFEYRVSPLEIRLKKTGQVIYFRGADDPIKLKSIKPEFGYIGILWKEEADQLSGAAEERSINQSVLRGGNIAYDFMSYNPPKSKSAWVHKEKLLPDPNRVLHHSTYLDAPVEWLGQKFIDDAEHLKEVNPEAYDHEYMGVANGDGGNVFEYLEIRDITDEEIATFDRIYQGTDWGYNPDPYAFVRIYYDHARETIYFIDEIYGTKMLNSDTGKIILERGYNDYIITCDSQENKSVADYRDMGIPARSAVKGPGSVEYGMKWLCGRKIVIDPRRTPNVHREFTEYEFERDKEGNLVSGYPDLNNHSIDATRYALESFYNKRGTSA